MAEKGVQVSATVPKEWADILEEHQWKARMKKTGIVRLAVQQYMEREGLIPVGPASHSPEDLPTG